MKKERFFITGGFGYIGSSFAREALKKGHDVLIYDSLIYEQNRHRMISEITENSTPQGEFIHVIGDTRNTELLRKTLEEFKPTYFMHWGDLSSVWSCNHNPTYTEDISHTASKSIVDICEELSIPLFFNSSSSVYGAQKENKLMTETDVLPNPSDLYCTFKLKMEEYITEKKQANPKFKAIVFRPATVFGISPRLRIELLPNHFTYMAIAHKVIKVADLNAYRAAIDIDELVEGYFKAVEKKSWNHLIYNIGHHNISKIEFSLGIQRVVDCKIVTMEDFGDLRNLQIDCSRFNEEFDFKPHITYEESIKKVATWIENNLETIQKNNFTELLNMPLSNWLKISN